jgi:hypothetical protein
MEMTFVVASLNIMLRTGVCPQLPTTFRNFILQPQKCVLFGYNPSFRRQHFSLGMEVWNEYAEVLQGLFIELGYESR